MNERLKNLMQSMNDLYSEDGKERVGFILENYSFIEVKNTADNPYEAYSVSGEDIKEYAINNAIGTWHTHPKASSNLSGLDWQNFMTWDNMFHLIIGNNGVSLYEYKHELNTIVETLFVPKEV